MDHYRKTLIINAEPSAVYAAIATQDGLRAWWTPTCTSDSHAGGKAHFEFGRTRKDMSIEQLDVNRGVRWFVTDAYIDAGSLARKSEWVGTEIAFRLTPMLDGKTRLDFEHVGLVPALECYDLCRGGWNHFLASLQQLVETGRGTPWVVEQQCAA